MLAGGGKMSLDNDTETGYAKRIIRQKSSERSTAVSSKASPSTLKLIASVVRQATAKSRLAEYDYIEL